MYLSTLLQLVLVVNTLHLNVLPGHSFERFENIARAPLEGRQFRGLKLNNGMKVMLISDDSTETSAASLVVGVGAFNDHPNVPGLVNLVGNVLLSGGGDNPSNFERFIESYEGAILAPHTSETHQSFSFRVPHIHFAVALQEFAQIFINPRMMNESNPNIIRKAVQALQREFLENAQDDDQRIAEVEKHMCEKLYFFNHLYCGSKDTLYEHVRKGRKKKSQDEENASLLKMVRVFYNLWYSSNLMTLAVLGREPLQDLEDMVVSLFENIENKNKEQVTYPVGYHPLGSEKVKRRLCIEPLDKNMQTVALTFPLPDFSEYHDAAPENYVKHYLLYAGPNTLVSVLRKRDLCTSAEFSYWSVANFSFVKIVYKVTELGLSVSEEIINLTFQYIYMLKDDGVQEWMQKQMRMSYERAFNYHNSASQSPLDFTLKMAYNLQDNRAIENILREYFIRFEWNPDAIRHFLSFLRPNNVNVTLVTRVCRSFHRILIQDQHYKAWFMIAFIPDEVITDPMQKWSTKESPPPLELPKPNELMPDTWQNFARDENEPREPHIIHESPISEIWFMQEGASNPEVFIYLEFFSSVVGHGLPERILWRLFYGLLKSFLIDHVSIPNFEERQWVTYNIRPEDRGMQIKLHGANDKLHILLERVLSKMSSQFEEYISEESFDASLGRYLKLMRVEIRQSHFFQSEQCIMQYSKYDDDWSVDNMLNFDGKLHYADLKKFLRKFFRRIFIRGLVYGNYTKQKALDDIVSVIEKSFSSSQGLLLKEVLKPRLIDPGENSSHFYRMFNRQHGLYGTSYLHQLGSNEPSPRDAVLSYLLHTIAFESCHKIFNAETENQPLAKVKCAIIQTYHAQKWIIQVVSKETPHNIDLKLKHFLHNVIPSIITDLPDDHFFLFKKEMESFFKPKSLSSIFSDYWKEITNRSYRFDRGQMQADILWQVEKSDLLEFVKENLHSSSNKRRKLTVHILPELAKRKDQKLVSHVPSGAIRIEDMFSYKTNAALLSHGFKSS